MTFSCYGTLETVITVPIIVHMALELAIEKFYTLSCMFILCIVMLACHSVSVLLLFYIIYVAADMHVLCVIQ